MLLSVVSGTWNRLPHLQAMVQSARESLYLNDVYYDYEFVIVDGGSTDGTIEWCNYQDDVYLIEQGELLGAVKAFNEGAIKAHGEYVILANDDITFAGKTIYNAVRRMLNNDGYLAMGAFQQNRNGKDWHVESMGLRVNGVGKMLVYGQICILPKYIGDEVGWWGNYLHTYGGDNELSCNIYELGYRIDEFKECRIRDNHADVMDELRKINNIEGKNDPRAINGQHPDSLKWGKKWSRKGLTIPPVDAIVSPIERRGKKILYLPCYEQGWAVQKQQKRGLREAMAKDNMVFEFDYTASSDPNKEFIERVMQLDPDIILTQLHNEGTIKVETIETIKEISNAILINWNGDFWPDNLINKSNNRGETLNSKFDIVGLVNRDFVETYKKHDINAKYWQIGWEEDGRIGEPKNPCDIIFLANGYNQTRQKFVKAIKNMRFNFDVYGFGWPNGWSKGQTTYDFKSGCELYRGAKIALGDSQWPDSGFVSNRIFQIICTGGATLFHQWFYRYEDLGLVHKENCIIWKDLNELESYIRYYLTRPEELKQMSKKAEKLALEHHSFDCRWKEMKQWIDEFKPNSEIINWRY